VQFLKALHFAKDVNDLVADIGTGLVPGGGLGGPVEEHVRGSPIGTVSSQHVENEVVVEVEPALVESSIQLFCGFVSSELEKVLDERGWTRMHEPWG